MNYNIFSFNGVYYRQTLGIAMGSACGPSIANIFVYIYEKKWLYIHKPIIYYRFIDDIFMVTDDSSCLTSSTKFDLRTKNLKL